MTGQEEVKQTIKQLMIRGRVQEIMAEACIVSNDTNTAKVYGRRAMVHYSMAEQLGIAIQKDCMAHIGVLEDEIRRKSKR